MSLDQRQFVSDITKWIMRISIAIAGFLLVDTYSEVKSDMHDIKTSLGGLENRMIRIEYELKLK